MQRKAWTQPKRNQTTKPQNHMQRQMREAVWQYFSLAVLHKGLC